MKKLLLFIPLLLLCGCRVDTPATSVAQRNDAPTTVTTNVTTEDISTIDATISTNSEQATIDAINAYINENIVSTWAGEIDPYDLILINTTKFDQIDNIEYYKTEIIRHNAYGYAIRVYLTTVIDGEIQECQFLQTL